MRRYSDSLLQSGTLSFHCSSAALRLSCILLSKSVLADVGSRSLPPALSRKPTLYTLAPQQPALSAASWASRTLPKLPAERLLKMQHPPGRHSPTFDGQTICSLTILACVLGQTKISCFTQKAHLLKCCWASPAGGGPATCNLMILGV